MNCHWGTDFLLSILEGSLSAVPGQPLHQSELASLSLYLSVSLSQAMALLLPTEMPLPWLTVKGSE